MSNRSAERLIRRMRSLGLDPEQLIRESEAKAEKQSTAAVLHAILDDYDWTISRSAKTHPSSMNLVFTDDKGTVIGVPDDVIQEIEDLALAFDETQGIVSFNPEIHGDLFEELAQYDRDRHPDRTLTLSRYTRRCEGRSSEWFSVLPPTQCSPSTTAPKLTQAMLVSELLSPWSTTARLWTEG